MNNLIKLSKINKFFAWIIVLLLVLGLAGFGLQDVLSRWGTSKLASIGEVEISSEEFAQSFIREINYISQNIGKNLTIEEAKSVGLHLQIMERLIKYSIFSISCHSGFLVHTAGTNNTHIIDIINKYLKYKFVRYSLNVLSNF